MAEGKPKIQGKIITIYTMLPLVRSPCRLRKSYCRFEKRAREHQVVFFP